MELIPLATDPDDAAGLGAVRLWHRPDGRRLAAFIGTEEGASELLTWELPGGRVVDRQFFVTDTEHGFCYPPPTLSPDHQYAAYFGKVVREMATGREVQLRGRPRPDPAARGGWLARVLRPLTTTVIEWAISPYGELAFSPDGRHGYAATATTDGPGRVGCWALDGLADPALTELRPTGAPLRSNDTPTRRASLAVSPDGDLLAGVTYHGDLFRWRLADRQWLSVTTVNSGRRAVSPIEFSPDGRTLAVPAGDVHLFDPLADRPRAELRTGVVLDLAFTSDGDRLLTAGESGVTVWDVATGQRLAHYDFSAHFGTAAAVSVAPDGLTAVAGGVSGPLVRWDL